MLKATKEPKLTVRKTAARKFREDGAGELRLIAPAEYEVVKGAETLARLVRAQDGWRVVVPTAASRFGEAVSPIGLERFRQVKEWALGYFAQGAA